LVQEGKNWYLCRERRTKSASVKEPIGNRGPEKKKELDFKRRCKRFRWSRGSVLAFGTPSSRIRTRPKPSDFLGRKKILSTLSFGGEVKPSVPCRSFTACKRSLNVTWKSPFRHNYRTFLAHSFTFRRWVLSRGDNAWRRLVAKVGTSNPDRTISLKSCSA